MMGFLVMGGFLVVVILFVEDVWFGYLVAVVFWLWVWCFCCWLVAFGMFFGGVVFCYLVCMVFVVVG